MGLRWQQQSAEARALQQQTFAQAEKQLKQLLEEYEDSEEGSGDQAKSPAIVTDLDETIIDNTQLLARDLEECHDYSDWSTWGHWEEEGEPALIPGALEFLKAADEMGVKINYISDRQEENLEPTLKTLRELGLPQLGEDEDSADSEEAGNPDNLLLLGPPKEERRDKVRENHHILMQLGDTLHDFDPRFADADLAEQQKLVEENAEHFGRDWIVLPNATYGSWEDAELDAWDKPLQTGEYN